MLQKILQELAAKQKEVIKAQTEAEKLFQEKGLDPGVQKLAEEMKLLQKQWEDTTQVRVLNLGLGEVVCCNLLVINGVKKQNY